MTTPADLTVQLRDDVDARVRDWPWVLLDRSTPAGVDPVWGDYPTKVDAELALRQATVHPECGHTLVHVDGIVCDDAFCNNSFDERVR